MLKSLILRSAQVLEQIHPSYNSIKLKENPFNVPLLAYLRSFKTNEPLQIIELSRSVFGSPIRQDIVQRAVVWYRAGLRAGTASSKDRSQVSGSRRKAFPQKGRGEARVGTLRAPHRRGGGACFGPKPRDFSFHLPRQVQTFSIRSALSSKFNQDQIVFVENESFELETHKTKSLLQLLIANGWNKKILLVDTKPLQPNFEKASRNLSNFSFLKIDHKDFNAYNILANASIIMTERAAQFCQEIFKPK